MKSILFINDNKAIRQEASDILSEEGYASIFADNYEEGIRIISSSINGNGNGNNISLVILDINILVESGIEIYDRIKDIDPNLPVVTTSTAGHYRPRLGSDKKMVRFGGNQVIYD